VPAPARALPPAAEDAAGPGLPVTRGGLLAFLAQRVWMVVGVLLFTVAAAILVPLVVDAANSTAPSTRSADPKPLSVAEFFPASSLIDPSGAGYTVEAAEANTDCDRIAKGEVQEALKAADCTDYVRATLASANRMLMVTAGVANLESKQAADTVRIGLNAIQAPFLGFSTGASTASMNSANSLHYWVSYGHYLAFCVIVNADRSPVTADQPGVQSIRDGLLRDYLVGEVLRERAT
jgi:hypothetical protein